MASVQGRQMSNGTTTYRVRWRQLSTVVDVADGGQISEQAGAGYGVDYR